MFTVDASKLSYLFPPPPRWLWTDDCVRFLITIKWIGCNFDWLLPIWMLCFYQCSRADNEYVASNGPQNAREIRTGPTPTNNIIYSNGVNGVTKYHSSRTVLKVHLSLESAWKWSPISKIVAISSHHQWVHYAHEKLQCYNRTFRRRLDIYKHITLTKTICDFFHTESNDTKYSNNKNCVDQNVEKYVLHSMHEN